MWKLIGGRGISDFGFRLDLGKYVGFSMKMIIFR